ncbi:MAG: HugZ family protein [Myxococcota bacterium]
MSDTEQSAIASRALLRSRSAGVLATASVAVPGYPLGSLVPYVLLPEGGCVIYISRIAQHTKNFEADPRASLTVIEADLSGSGGDPQATGRVSVLGDARVLSGDERDAAKARYATFFPESVGHSGVHDFEYWQIDPQRVRYIGGFGAIHWVERDAFCLPAAEWQEGEAGIVQHMNEDHRAHMAMIWTQHQNRGQGDGAETGASSSELDPAEAEPIMLGSDPEGFHMRWAEQMLYVPYAKRCETALDVRKEMVRLTKEARESAASS